MRLITCSQCGTAMEDYGIQKIRIGGAGGEWSYILGDIMEVEQETLPVHIHICPKCSKIEMTAIEETGANLQSGRAEEMRRMWREDPISV